MGGLSAAVYKDLKLFLRGGGLAALLLPLLLVPALRFGMGDLSVQAYVQPFPIAVRDLDNTINALRRLYPAQSSRPSAGAALVRL